MKQKLKLSEELRKAKERERQRLYRARNPEKTALLRKQRVDR